MNLVTPRQPLIEVAFQTKENGLNRCGICPQRCVLDEGALGVCGGRQVIDGRLVAVNYAQVSSLHLDPIEKKPLYHFYPGSEILSVGPNGCNLSCAWCQNWQISQNTSPTRTILPAELADIADAADSIGVAYTYAEPLVWFEYIRDAGRIFRERGLVNVFVTNGYVNAEPLKEILQIADAFNVDLKSADDFCYRNYCGGRLEDVRRTIQMIHDAGKHLEVTHLVVTGLSDDLRKIERLSSWLADLDPSIPLHLSRYFPNNRYLEPATTSEFLVSALEVARSKLNWVYLGNIWLEVGQDSRCPGCGAVLVRRRGYEVEVVGLTGNRCTGCGRELPFQAAA
jgi:pyruvate formate lyase activating enzyme